MEQELLVAAEWARGAWGFVGNNAANIIALAATAFMAYQAWLTRGHNRLSVRPHLQTHIHTQAERGDSACYKYAFELRNAGLGPAVVKKVTVFLDGKEQALATAKDVEALIRGLIPPPLDLNTLHIVEGEAIRAHDSRTLLAFRLPPLEEAQLKGLEEQLGRLDLVIEYASMYGERYKPLDTRDEPQAGA